MDSGGGSASGVHEEDTESKRSNQSYNRHNPQQIHCLETFFKECAHPDVKQRKQISRELGLEPCQIKFWFQNKRTIMKTQFERADNNSLRRENERLKCENLALEETLRNLLCPTCGGPSFSKDELKHKTEKLRLENANLKKESERVANQVAQLTGKQISKINSWVSTGSPLDFSVEGVSCMGMSGSALNICHSYSNSTFSTSRSQPISRGEISAMVETAVGAMDELRKVLTSGKPLWTSKNGRYSLNKDCYKKVFMRPPHYKPNNAAKLESSKDSCNLAINAIILVNMLLDSSMRLDLFPTLVTKTEILQVLETGMPGNRSGSLHLIHEVMHSLSPLVAPREFYILRFCQQVEIDTWVIVDVSYGIRGDNNGNQVPHCWKLPSGCMIQAMPDGHSKVTWVELVEVDIGVLTHRLYRDLVTSGFVFGAERWIATLKQMCERAVLSSEVPAKSNTLDGTTWSAEGKSSLMDMSHQMVKEFCATLNMPFSKLDFPHVPETVKNGVLVSTRKCTDLFKPEGMVICVSTCLWLPVCPQHVFAFFQDNKMRSQWDCLSHGNPAKEIVRAACGHHLGNNVSVFQPVAPNESSTAILQESLTDPLGYYLVFAPLEFSSLNMAVNGSNLSNVAVLPSGFVITSDGHCASSKDLDKQSTDGDAGGSLVTVAFQILWSDSAYSMQKHMEVVVDANTLLSSTVEKIKAALTPKSSSAKTAEATFPS